MTKEMYAANVKNWLMDLATGVKAAQKSMQFADAYPDREWEVTSKCYYDFERGIGVHNIKDIAELINEPVKFGTFDEKEYLYTKYEGYWYIDLFGVRFYDFGEPKSVGTKEVEENS